jgi:hypothetical protein
MVDKVTPDLEFEMHRACLFSGASFEALRTAGVMGEADPSPEDRTGGDQK